MTGIRIEGATAPPATPSADAAIVAGLVAHDRAAVADLYDRYGDRLLGFCSGMLRDGHEAADALHDTILVAADRAGQLRDPERLRPWLYAIARTQCLARLRRRDRTLVAEDPTELAEGRPMSAEAGVEGDGARAVEGGEAAELVWAAAEGLDEGDRVLLELQLRQGLQGGELAAAAGVRPGQISMATGRMRERLERALGALLVARHGRRDCAELDGILRDWDGRLTVLMRKRVARHVERCTVCDERRTGLVAPLGSLAVGGPLALAASDLRADLLGAVDRMWGAGPTTTTAATATDVAGGWDDDGFPTDPALADAGAGEGGDGTARSRRRAAVAAVAAVLLVVAGLVAWRASADDAAADEVRAEAGAVATTDGGAQTDPQSDEPDGAHAGPGDEGDAPSATAPATTTSPPATAPVAPTPTTTPDAVAGPTGPSAGPTSVPDDVGSGGSGGSGDGSSGGGSTGGGGTGGGITVPPTTAPPPADRPPSITSVQVPTDLFTACGSPSTGTVTVQTTDPDGLGGLAVAFRVEGPDGVQTPAAQPLGGGRFRATIGPFIALGAVSVRVTVTDPTGLSDSESRSVPLQLAPC